MLTRVLGAQPVGQPLLVAPLGRDEAVEKAGSSRRWRSPVSRSRSVVQPGPTVSSSSPLNSGLQLQQPAPRRHAVRLVDDPVRMVAGRSPRTPCCFISSVCSAETPFTRCEVTKLSAPMFTGPCEMIRGASGRRPDAPRVPVLDRGDDLVVPRQDARDHVLGPALQRLGQQRVVGVGEAALRRLDRLGQREAVLVGQQAHQLGPGDRGMRVVQLDRRLLGQPAQVVVFREEPAQDVAHRGGGEEILLLQAQLAALGRAVVGIEHAADRAGQRLGRARRQEVAAVEALEVEVARRLGRPEAQRVRPAPLPADDRRVVGGGQHGRLRVPGDAVGTDAAAEADRVATSGRSNSQAWRCCSQSSGVSTCRPSSKLCRKRPCS